jgi:hypothetical protein
MYSKAMIKGRVLFLISNFIIIIILISFSYGAVTERHRFEFKFF